jgi:hypothetical protein
MAFALPIALWMCLGQAPAPASGPAVTGVVVNAQTAAPIADARVMLVELARSVQTGQDGRFQFQNVAPGSYTLTVSLIGYVFVRRHVDVAPGGAALDLTIPLAEGTGAYQETVSVKPAASTAEVGVGSQQDLGSAALQDLRGVAADDPMRALQALPGVATGDDFQSQFSVRGSQFRHVGIVLDGTATPLLLHTVRSTNDTGVAPGRGASPAARRLAGRHARLRPAGRLEGSDRVSRRGQRDQRVADRRRTARTAETWVVARVDPEELHRLVDPQDLSVD